MKKMNINPNTVANIFWLIGLILLSRYWMGALRLENDFEYIIDILPPQKLGYSYKIIVLHFIGYLLLICALLIKIKKNKAKSFFIT